MKPSGVIHWQRVKERNDSVAAVEHSDATIKMSVQTRLETVSVTKIGD